MPKKQSYIGIGPPTTPLLDSNILEAIKKAQGEETRITEELSKAQTNEKAKELFERFEENRNVITKLIETLRKTMRDMI